VNTQWFITVFTTGRDLPLVWAI